jgi:hypothetical protein
MAMHNGDGDGFQIIEERAIPDIYSDSVRFDMTVYGVTLEFGQGQKPRPTGAGPAPHVPKIRINMSPQHAKVLAKLFAKTMASYEQQIGKISLPQQLLDDLNIEDEW